MILLRNLGLRSGGCCALGQSYNRTGKKGIRPLRRMRGSSPPSLSHRFSFASTSWRFAEYFSRERAMGLSLFPRWTSSGARVCALKSYRVFNATQIEGIEFPFGQRHGTTPRSKCARMLSVTS